MRHLAILTLVLAVVAPGCVPTEFDDRRGEAAIIDVQPPDDYPNQRFGAVVAGYGATLTGAFSSRVAGSAGEDTPFTVYPLYIDGELRLDTPTIDGCDTESPCEIGSSGSLVGMPTFSGRTLCIATAATEGGQIKIKCEDDATRFETIAGPSAIRFGVSGTGLRASHAFGSAIYGAPGDMGGLGGVYRLSGGSPPSGLDLSMGSGVGRELGTEVAIGIIDADTVLIAAGAPGATDKRVIAATVDIDATGAATTSVVGCFDSTSPDYGAALAIGDFNGDGMQDLAIGSGPAEGSPAESRDATIHIYSGAAMGAPGSCVDGWSEAATISCPDTPEVTCDANALFGSALAVGDVNADGRDDLIVGARGATVDDVTGAGAVYIFPGVDDPDLRSFGMGGQAVVHSSPTRGAEIGFDVAAAPGLSTGAIRRDEVIAGAPGVNRIYVMLCTGVDGDSVSDFDGTRCQPTN